MRNYETMTDGQQDAWEAVQPGAALDALYAWRRALIVRGLLPSSRRRPSEAIARTELEQVISETGSAAVRRLCVGALVSPETTVDTACIVVTLHHKAPKNAIPSRTARVPRSIRVRASASRAGRKPRQGTGGN